MSAPLQCTSLSREEILRELQIFEDYLPSDVEIYDAGGETESNQLPCDYGDDIHHTGCEYYSPVLHVALSDEALLLDSPVHNGGLVNLWDILQSADACLIS